MSSTHYHSATHPGLDPGFFIERKGGGEIVLVKKGRAAAKVLFLDGIDTPPPVLHTLAHFMHVAGMAMD